MQARLKKKRIALPENKIGQFIAAAAGEKIRSFNIINNERLLLRYLFMNFNRVSKKTMAAISHVEVPARSNVFTNRINSNFRDSDYKVKVTSSKL